MSITPAYKSTRVWRRRRSSALMPALREKMIATAYAPIATGALPLRAARCANDPSAASTCARKMLGGASQIVSMIRVNCNGT